MKTTAKFEIKYLQYLDEKAKPANKMPDFCDDEEVLTGLYRDMALVRALDKRAVQMQRTGKMRTYPSSLGQEAVGVGAGSVLKSTDVLVPYYRGTATMLQKGVKPHEILLYWGGDERGSDFSDENCKEDFPIAVPIATQMLHAAGVASAIKYRKQKDRAVLTEIGEGGTSEGEFYEALNVAGVWDLPMVCIINNNQWAISVPSELQTKCETYAQKAIAAGMEGIRVDGNDVIAMRDAADYALDKARKGKGPTLIEAVTYRLSDHTTADDATRYHDPEIHKMSEKKEPMGRLGKYLVARGTVKKKQLEEFEAQAKGQVDEAVKIYTDYMENKPQPSSAMFDHLYAELPEKTKPQREEAIRRGRE